jgi:hypothetical protein
MKDQACQPFYKPLELHQINHLLITSLHMAAKS